MIRAGALALVSVLSCRPVPAAEAAGPTGHGWSVGADGWSLEQFGPDVTILRSRMPADPAHDASLLLSCSHGDRRLRLTLPATLPARSSNAARGIALVRERARDANATNGFLGRFDVPGARQIEFRDGREGGGIVPGIVRMLQGRVQEIEMLLRYGRNAPIAGRGLTVYVVAPIFGAGDAALLAHVASACGDGSSPRE